MAALLQPAADVAYRLGLGPRPSDTPDHRLVEVVEGPDRMRPGRALDLGSATGRNALYLAGHGWDTTGVEMSGQAIRIARRKAAAAGLSVRFLEGDVTKLAKSDRPTSDQSILDIGFDYQLLMDGGCYHMVPHSRRDAYVRGVTEVSAPGALLIMVGFGTHLSLGVNRDELLARFGDWELLAADRVPGEQMHEYVSGPAPLRAMLHRDWFHPMRYQLRRLAA
jgi:SAM-dependent methyltransferase